MLNFDCKIAATVILYNSDDNVLDCINSYIGQVQRLYVVDNSEIINDRLKSQLIKMPSVRYLHNEENCGIAYALNVAATRALADGFDYLLTMDDDTVAPPSMVKQLVKCLFELSDFDRVAIISANQTTSKCTDLVSEVFFTMTSGNLVNLAAYQLIGPYTNELFIDHVDHEYCIRAINLNYKIFVANTLHMSHRLGEKKEVRLINKKLTFVSHSPLRLYYNVRNSIYIFKKYAFNQSTASLLVMKSTVKEILKSILLEDNKKARLMYMYRGCKDGLLGRMGKYVK